MSILSVAQVYVANFFRNNEQASMVYHNYEHTAEVANAAEVIAKGSELSDEEMELVLLAAWFHDTGYIKRYIGHEEESVRYATDFLTDQNYSAEKIKIVTSAIMATQFPQQPKNLLEQVLCDADLAHLGKKRYLEKSRLLHLEQALVGQPVDDENWVDIDAKFLSGHTYFTAYAQRKYRKQKTKNTTKLKDLDLDNNMKAKKKEKKKIKKGGDETPQRGIETLFRVSFKNHMDLSSIADNKANIMLSINAIIISISLSVLVPQFGIAPHLIIPSAILIAVCVGTIIFATLSTLPKVTSGKFTLDDVKKRKANLLFFGNFHRMPIEEFEWGMNEMMKSSDFLYGSMIRDIYSLGTVLARKYKYLRLTYNFFMYGMILAVLSFVVVL